MNELFVFSPDFSDYHEVQYISLNGEEYYNAVGKITVIVAATEYNIEHLHKDAFLYRKDTKQAFWIRRVVPNTTDNTITISGYTTNALLNKRVFAVSESYNGFVDFAPKNVDGIITADGDDFGIKSAVENAIESQLYFALENNLRGLPNISFASVKDLTETYTGLFDHGQMLDEIIQALNLTPYGQRMNFDHRNKRHVFEIYEGKDLTFGSKAVRFSEERGTAKNLVIDLDDSLLKNVCYARGKKADESYITVIVGDAENDDRFEFWLDQEFSQGKDESDAEFEEKIKTECKKALAERAAVQNFSIDIDPSEYGTVFSLGDKVSCVSKRFGVKFDSRITAVEFTQDPQIKTTKLVLGNPTINILKEMKLWLK